MNCEYCNKSFKTKSSLNNHQKTTKFCLKIQEEKKKEQSSSNKSDGTNQDEDIDNYKNKICKFCGTTLENPNDIQEHFDIICKPQFEEHKKKFIELLTLNEQLSSETLKLKEKNNKLELLIQNQKNNDKLAAEEVVTTYFEETVENIKKCIEEHFTYDYLIGGQEGIANFTIKHILNVKDKPVYLCVNYKKCIFNFVSKKGDILKDVNAKLLTKILWEAEIFQKVHKLSVQKFLDMNSNELRETMIYYEDIRNLENDNQVFRDCLIKLL